MTRGPVWQDRASAATLSENMPNVAVLGCLHTSVRLETALVLRASGPVHSLLLVAVLYQQFPYEKSSQISMQRCLTNLSRPVKAARSAVRRIATSSRHFDLPSTPLRTARTTPLSRMYRPSRRILSSSAVTPASAKLSSAQATHAGTKSDRNGTAHTIGECFLHSPCHASHAAHSRSMHAIHAWQ